MPAKKVKNNHRRKRTRGDSQGSRVAKKQRLESNRQCQQHISISQMYDSPNFSPAQEPDSEAEGDESVELIPSSVTLERAKPKEATPKRKAQKYCGFKNLLDQLRGNSSMIIKETR